MPASATIRSGTLGALALGISVSCAGCGQGRDQKVPGLESFHAGMIQDRLYLSLVSKSLKWDAGITVPIPGIDGATLSVAPDLQSQGGVIQFTAPLASLSGKEAFYPSSGLPDGRPLPDIASGALPRWDLPIRSLTISFYLSNEAFALFIPLGFLDGTSIPAPWLMSATIRDERGNRIGKVYLIPSAMGGKPSAATGEGSGLFALLPSPGGTPPKPATSRSGEDGA